MIVDRALDAHGLIELGLGHVMSVLRRDELHPRGGPVGERLSQGNLGLGARPHETLGLHQVGFLVGQPILRHLDQSVGRSRIVVGSTNIVGNLLRRAHFAVNLRTRGSLGCIPPARGLPEIIDELAGGHAESEVVAGIETPVIRHAGRGDCGRGCGGGGSRGCNDD